MAKSLLKFKIEKVFYEIFVEEISDNLTIALSLIISKILILFLFLPYPMFRERNYLK